MHSFNIAADVTYTEYSQRGDECLWKMLEAFHNANIMVLEVDGQAKQIITVS